MIPHKYKLPINVFETFPECSVVVNCFNALITFLDTRLHQAQRLSLSKQIFHYSLVRHDPTCTKKDYFLSLILALIRHACGRYIADVLLFFQFSPIEVRLSFFSRKAYDKLITMTGKKEVARACG